MTKVVETNRYLGHEQNRIDCPNRSFNEWASSIAC
jgi:hypothetical protein